MTVGHSQEGVLDKIWAIKLIGIWQKNKKQTLIYNTVVIGYIDLCFSNISTACVPLLRLPNLSSSGFPYEEKYSSNNPWKILLTIAHAFLHCAGIDIQSLFKWKGIFLWYFGMCIWLVYDFSTLQSGYVPLIIW